MFGIIASLFHIDILKLKKPKDRFHHPPTHEPPTFDQLVHFAQSLNRIITRRPSGSLLGWVPRECGVAENPSRCGWLDPQCEATENINDS